tara:strand:+ start:4898 stop:5653 length:756 start_codon:yes stop_codon:yes gene_type:complete
MNIKQLIKKSLELRKKTFLTFIKMGEAHLGGSFSMIEILVFLFNYSLKKNDKFILSKAHASVPFCLLLKEKGYTPKISTHLEIDVKNKIYCTTGSLGHGLPIAAGMAMARKKQGLKGKIYVLISDGECQEGTTWETLLIAAKHKLDNLLILVDYNKIQALDFLSDALPLNNLKKKFLSFNCNCIEVKKGHNFNSIRKAFINLDKNKNLPSVIVFHTVKGKGIKEFENDPMWHAKKIREKEIKIGKKSLGLS